MFNWIDFFIYVIITAITPGPNNIMSMSNGSKFGFKKGLSFNFGIWTGFSIVMIICSIFCTVLSTAIPKIKVPMLIIGALYMLYLAWKTYKSNSDLEASNFKSGYISGLLLQFVNPKIYIYGIVSMQAYILPFFAGKYLYLLFWAIFLATVGFICTLLWSAFGSIFKIIFLKYAKVTNIIMALLLVYCAVSLFYN